MRYYERELAYVRMALGKFSKQYPEEAGHLGIGQSSVEDPNINRLIEGMALLTAKTEERLDQQFPDLVQDLFTLLYPGMLEPVPSYFPLRLIPNVDMMNENQQLAAGSSISVGQENQMQCQFTTVSDLNIYPFILTDVIAESAPFTTRSPPSLHHAKGLIQLHLQCSDPTQRFDKLDLGDLEFYVNGFEGNSQPLINLLLTHCCSITLSDLKGHQHQEISVGSLINRVTQTHFQWLSQHGNQFSGYDLLRDYFCYPDKSAYFSVSGFSTHTADLPYRDIVLNLYLDYIPAEILRLFNHSVFSLYTVPAINRFAQSAEPMQYNSSSLAMPVFGDAQSQSSIEVIKVEAVYEIDYSGEWLLNPLYKRRHRDHLSQRTWQSRQHWNSVGEREIELSVSVSEQELARDYIPLALDLVCSNGRAPCNIAKHSEVTNLGNVDLPGILRAASVPTGPIYPDLKHDLYWRFIALLNANFSSLLHASEPTEVLRDMLALCNLGSDDSALNAIKDLSFKPTVGSVQVGNQSIFSTGCVVMLTLDKRELMTVPHVFPQVINAFLQQFCSYDRFIQLEVRHFGDDSYCLRFEPLQGSQLCL